MPLALRLCRLLPLLALFSPGFAFALGAGEALLEGGAGAAVANEDRAGVQVTARLVRGISDAWAGHLGVATTWCPSSAGPSLHVTTQTIGATLAFDAVNLVPFLDLALLAADVRGGGAGASWHVGGEVGGGVDYLPSRHLVTSIIAHLDYLPLRLVGPHRERPLQATLVVLVGRAF